MFCLSADATGDPRQLRRWNSVVDLLTSLRSDTYKKKTDGASDNRAYHMPDIVDVLRRIETNETSLLTQTHQN